jgi:hypothetical protein
MDTGNLLALVGTALTIVSLIIGAIVYFHGIAMAEIEKVRDSVDDVQRYVHSIEKDMMKSSDIGVKRIITLLEERIDDVEHKSRQVVRELKTVKEDIQPMSDMTRLAKSDDRTPIPGSVEGRIAFLQAHDEENRRDIATLKKIVKAHQHWFKDLSTKKD